MTVDAPKLFPGFQKERMKWWIWGAVLAVIIFTGGIRLRLAELPLERDEGEYAYTGQLMLQGIPPYQGSYFMKLPGTHAMYALGMAVFGQTRVGVHRWLLVVNAASIALVFLLGRKLADPEAGLIACAAYGVMSLSPCVMGPVAHATQFVMLYALAGMFVLCKALESGHGAVYFLSGLLFGVAVLMKQPGAFFAVFGALLIVWSGRRMGPMRWQSVFKRGAIYSCGVVLPYAVTCLVLWRAGVFAKFWFWTVTCVRDYGTAVPLSQGLQFFGHYFILNLDASMVLWFLAVAGAVCIWQDGEAGTARVFIPALLVISLAAVSQGLYFRPHYFIQLLPGLALALGVGASSLRRLIVKARPESALATMPGKYMAAALLAVVLGLWKFFFVATPEEVSHLIYHGGEGFVECVEIADYVKSHTAPGERIAVFGSEPEIYFYSGRHSVSGYIYMYNMMEGGPYAKQMQQDLIRQLEDARPEYMVFVKMPNSWDRTDLSETLILDWGAKYCRDFYDIVGEVDFPEDKPSKFYWGKEAAAAAPLARQCMYVLKRKALAADNVGAR
jgi:hypothetical protein